MTRMSNLLIATGLALLPMSAFAQQSLTTMQSAPSSATAPASATTTPKSPSVKTGATVSKTQHAKIGTKASTPVKTAEPSKS